MHFTNLCKALFAFMLAASCTPCKAQKEWKQKIIKEYTADHRFFDAEKAILKRDSRGFLWIGTQKGLCRFDGRSFSDYTTLDGLVENTITGIQPGKDGQVYIFTPSAIHRYTGCCPAFYRITDTSVTARASVSADDHADHTIENIVKDEAGHEWSLTDNGLLQVYNKVYTRDSYPSREYYFIKDQNGRKILMNDGNVHGPKLQSALSYKGSDGTWWYITNNGIYYLLPGTKKLISYLLPAESNHCKDSSFMDITEDATGGIWLSVSGCVWHYKYGHFSHIDIQEPVKNLTAIDSLVILATGAGLFTFNKQGLQPLPVQPGQGIITITIDKEKNLWINTGTSILYKIKILNGMTFSITDSVEIAVNGEKAIPEAITIDGSGNLWVITRFKMHIFLKQPRGGFSTENQIVLAGDQRIADLTRDHVSMFTGNDDQVYLRSSSNLYIFRASSIIETYYREAPKLHLLSVHLISHRQNKYLHQWITCEASDSGYRRMKSWQNAFSFYFTALSPVDGAGVVYRYKLAGLENEWQPLDKQQKAAYNNLPPGDYTFMVQAANVSGVWCQPVTYSFTILTPWYRTRWAYVIGILLILTCVLLLLGYYLPRRREMKRILTEQKLKVLRAQINPHFLQNTFEFLAQSLRWSSMENSLNTIHKIASYFRHILRLTDETVITVEDEIAMTEQYLSMQRMIFYERFSYSISTAENVDTIGVFVPSMLLQPLVENALKHGIDILSGTGRISIGISQDDHFIHITIADTGRRQDAAKKSHKPKGISITLERLNLLYRDRINKPSINMALNEEGGHTVEVKIPLA